MMTLWQWRSQTPFFREAAPLQVYGSVPGFTFTERSAKAVDSADLAGKVWIAGLIFTRCAGPCPMITARMKQIQEEWKKEPDFRLVSFTVDPEYDTPEVLKAYADGYQADPERWLFLTGEKEEIFELSQKYFHLGVAEAQEGEESGMAQGVLHSTQLVLVDRRSRIRGYYDSQDPSRLKQLNRDLQRLLADSNPRE